MPWVREGDCPPERCQGRCCDHIGIWYDKLTPGVVDFMSLLKTRGFEVMGDDSRYFLKIDQRCQHLTADGLCALHPAMHPNPNLPRRPKLCNEWPTEPAQLISVPECGYTFSWSEEEIGVHA